MKLIPEKTHAYATRNVDNIPFFNIRHNFFKNLFFSSTIIEWSNLDSAPCKSKHFAVFKNNILKFIRPFPSNVIDCDNHKGIRFITRLCVSLRYLRERRFKHIFQDCLKLICSGGLDIESTSHFLLYCPVFNDERYTLRSALNNTDCKLPELTNSPLSQSLLHGNKLFNKEEKNTLVLNAAIEFILSTERFEEPLI